MSHGRLVIAATTQFGENETHSDHTSEKSECVHFVYLLLYRDSEGPRKQILPACPGRQGDHEQT